jgi:5-methylcytosine-specific restriction enzyme B
MLANSWIFQGRPETWNVNVGVRTLRRINWVVRRYKDKIAPGDRVFVWEAGAESGIVATATVISAPACIEDSPGEAELYPQGPPPGFQGKQLRAAIEIEKVLNPRIRKTELLRHPLLKDLSIIRSAQGTNFSVTHDQAIQLEALAGSR